MPDHQTTDNSTLNLKKLSHFMEGWLSKTLTSLASRGLEDVQTRGKIGRKLAYFRTNKLVTMTNNMLHNLEKMQDLFKAEVVLQFYHTRNGEQVSFLLLGCFWPLTFPTMPYIWSGVHCGICQKAETTVCLQIRCIVGNVKGQKQQLELRPNRVHCGKCALNSKLLELPGGSCFWPLTFPTMHPIWRQFHQL